MKAYLRALLLISLTIYAASLFMPTFYIDREDEDAWSNGFGNLLVGWLSGQVSWFANPLLFIAWIFAYKRNRFGALVFAGFGLVLMLQFLFVDEVLTAESGATSKVTQWLIGYWFWVCSSAVIVVGLGFSYLRKERPDDSFYEFSEKLKKGN